MFNYFHFVFVIFLFHIEYIICYDFKEEIFVKPLPPNHLYTYFQFVTQEDSENHYQHTKYLPRPLSEIISKFKVEELHLSLTEGTWRHQHWGYPILDAPSGAELYAWFSPQTQNIDEQWKKLAELLSGLFCASLNFINNHNTVSPKMTLWPSGVYENFEANNYTIRYSLLPKEIVCTENLTPWKKLLPCESARGFSTLLNSRQMHNTKYHSIGVHFRKVCGNEACTKTLNEVKQTVSLVYDHKIVGSNDWSLRKLFGQGLPGACPLSSSSRIYVDLESSNTQPFELTPPPDEILTSQRGGSDITYAVYNVQPSETMFNVAAVHKQVPGIYFPSPPPLYFNRYIVGYGQEVGGIVTDITNNFWGPIVIVLLENVPWWIPIRLSSLRVNGVPDSKLILSQYFSPGRNRVKPYQLELLLKLPPRSTTKVSIEFEYYFLKWQEYPPDANHGFYVGSAIITANLPSAKNYTSIPLEGSTIDAVVNATQTWYPITLRTGDASVSLPTPDFSMPYNVICLACTVVALAFGPLHNICTKQLLLMPATPTRTFLQKVLYFLKIKRE